MYEVAYWNVEKEREISYTFTNSIIKAIWLVSRLEKRYHCVSIKFRRNKVKQKKSILEAQTYN